MSDDGGFRRLLPPQRDRPGLVAVLIRWRMELVIAGLAAAAWHYDGGVTLGIVALHLGVLVAFVPVVRSVVIGTLQAIMVPHRVRSGLVQTGVTDRSGRPPWILWARPLKGDVRVYIWLRSGTTPNDLRMSAPILAAACGAVSVTVEQPGDRNDRAVLIVDRPRWGWLGR